ncbi:uncharacterized protein LOC144433730 [Glandiceps talaboti]
MATNDDLYVLEATDGTVAYVDATEIDDKHITEALGSGSVQAGVRRFVDESKVMRVYRKMGIEEFEMVKERTGMVEHRRNPNTNEMWISESIDHTKSYQNRGVERAGTTEVAAEFKVGRKDYQVKVKDHTIPQPGSGAVNKKRMKANERPYNISNKERIPHQSWDNVGLKGRENIGHFNDTVISVKKVDVHSLKNTNKFTRWVGHNKLGIGLAAVGIALDAASIAIAVQNDDGKFGPHTTLALSGTVGGTGGSIIGGEIGAALGSVFPGVGTAIGALIGSLLGGIIGSYAAEAFAGIWVSLRHVAPGPGPPPLAFSTIPSGPPPLESKSDVHGSKQLEFDSKAKGAIGLNFKSNVHGYPGLRF